MTKVLNKVTSNSGALVSQQEVTRFSHHRPGSDEWLVIFFQSLVCLLMITILIVDQSYPKSCISDDHICAPTLGLTLLCK